MNTWDPIDMAWVAGIIEGEGNIAVRSNERRVAVHMTDRDVIQKIYDITGVGTVSTYQRKEENYKDVWCWNVWKKEDVYRLLTAVVLFMGERRTKELLVVSDSILEDFVKHCEKCHFTFVGSRKSQRFCSQKCRTSKDSDKGKWATCLMCPNQFIKFKSNHVCCSKKCNFQKFYQLKSDTQP